MPAFRRMKCLLQLLSIAFAENRVTNVTRSRDYFTLCFTLVSPPANDTRELFQHQRKSMHEIKPGRYCHYKGRDYLVLDVARHSETEEMFVVYRPDYGDRSLWIRPLAMFIEEVMVEGKKIPRFQYVGPE